MAAPLTPHERIVGSLLGGAIGDALGAPIEFDRLDDIRSRHGAEGIAGFLPAYGRVGAITDDTQMTLFTAEGLLRAQARRDRSGKGDDIESIRLAYLRWLDTQGGSHRGINGDDGWLLTHADLHHARAPGNTCISALQAGGRGTPKAPLNDSKGCGGVMRVAPIGAVPRDRFAIAVGAAALTHGHASGYLSAGVLAHMLGNVIEGVPLPLAVTAARDELMTWPAHGETLHALDAATAAAAAGPVEADTLESLGGGWVGEEALAIGVCCALVADDLRSGLLLAVNHSGDSDSTGSITGNLLGAMHGFDALPGDLLELLELRDVITTVGQDLAAAFVDRTEVDADRYPPS